MGFGFSFCLFFFFFSCFCFSWVSLCILVVYLVALHTFFNRRLITYIKKKFSFGQTFLLSQLFNYVIILLDDDYVFDMIASCLNRKTT